MGPSWLWMVLLGLALVAFTGCPEDDDDAADDDDDTSDDDTADDDDTGDDDSSDDDSGDDDTDPDPECTYGTDWMDVIGSEDAAGDASGYMFDIKSYEYQWDGTTIHFRLTSHVDYDDFDSGLMTDMYVGDGAALYSLTWDHIKPNPGPLQIWSNADNWAAPLPKPASYCMSTDDSDSIVIGIDLADLDASFATQDVLQGHASVYLWSGNGYVDSHPDSAENVVFPLVFEPNVALGTITWDDVTGGNGDGIIDAGETGNLGIDLTNVGYADTGANLSATITLNGNSTAAAAINTDTAAYNAGAALAVDATASPDAPFVVQVDVGALEGQTLMFDVAVTDDASGSWALTTAPMVLGVESLLSDPDDFAFDFDLAGFYFTTDGTDLNLLVSSYDNHSADQEIDVFMDVDLDGQADYAISTYDSTSGGYAGGGGIFEWDGGWNEIDQPTSMDYDSGSNFVAFEVARSQLGGAIQFQAWVQSIDPSGYEVDTMPDDTSDPLTWGQGTIVNAPWILLDMATWTENTGNGDAFIEAGETWDVALSVVNQGTADSMVTTGVLASSDAEITVDQANVDFGAITVGNIGNGDVVATITVDGGAPDSAVFVLDLEVTADTETYNLAIPVALGVQPTDTTAGAPEVGTAMVLYGDTTGFVDDYQNPKACTTYSATSADGVYAINLAANQAFTADIAYDVGGPDAVLYISDDAAAPDVNCLAGADNNFDETETLNYTPTAAGLYYLIVDGYYTDDAGPYTLTLTF